MKHLNGIKLTDDDDMDNMNMDMPSKLFEHTAITATGNGDIDLKYNNANDQHKKKRLRHTKEKINASAHV